MRLFGHIAASAAIAVAVSLTLQFLFQPRPAFDLVGDGIFFASLAIWTFLDKPSPTIANILASQFVFILFALVCAVAGLFVMQYSEVLGVALASFMGLGYYPSGPDVPFFYAAPGWSLSILALTGAAIGAGRLLRVIRRG